jgi:hypothetical protein
MLIPKLLPVNVTEVRVNQTSRQVRDVETKSFSQIGQPCGHGCVRANGLYHIDQTRLMSKELISTASSEACQTRPDWHDQAKTIYKTLKTNQIN